MTNKQYAIIILILGALATISPFAIDMYLPGFPAIAKDLNTSIAQVQLSLTSYFIGIAAGQLLYGPLLDRFGRKRPLYVGLVVYILASVGCAFVTSVDALIAMRFLQALGGCAGMVAAQALVRDLFKVDKTAQAFSWITLVVAVSPMIAPTVGGYMTAALGWHSVFIALAVITSLMVVAVYFVLPEGHQPDKSISLKPRAVVHNFLHVIQQPQFTTYCLAGGLATAAPFAYIAGSAHVLINVYGASEKEYGLMFAVIGGVIIGSTQLNHIFLKYFKSEQIVKSALIYQMITGALLIAGTFMGVLGKYSMVAMIAVFLAGHGLSNPNATALSLAPFKKLAGSAASLSGAFRMGMGGLTSALVSVFHNGTELPMIIIMVTCVIAGYVVLMSANKIVTHRANKRKVEDEPTVLV